MSGSASSVHPAAGGLANAQPRRYEEIVRFRQAMQRLDDTSRQVVELAWFQQLAHRELAERLGITEAHSRVLLSRALVRIAKLATE